MDSLHNENEMNPGGWVGKMKMGKWKCNHCQNENENTENENEIVATIPLRGRFISISAINKQQMNPSWLTMNSC